MSEILQKMERKLYIKNYDRMVDDILTGIQNGDVILDPDYQRNYVWTNEKASRLIESILLNIPIPVIYASEDEDLKWNIVDGLQRLHSLKRFKDGEFRLKGLETLEDLNGYKFEQLDFSIQKKLLRGELRIVVLQNESDSNIQYDIFMRLNSGAVRLNEQELRNCLYRGRLNNTIKKIVANNNEIKQIFSLGQIARMAVNELIIRYAAVSEAYDKTNFVMKNYDGRFKNLLNKFMKQYQNPSDDFLINFENKYNDQIKKAFVVFGESAFKLDNSTRINAPLYDCIMISFEEYQIEELELKKEQIIAMTSSIIHESEFEKRITIATNNTDSVNNRIKTYYEKLKEVME